MEVYKGKMTNWIHDSGRNRDGDKYECYLHVMDEDQAGRVWAIIDVPITSEGSLFEVTFPGLPLPEGATFMSLEKAQCFAESAVVLYRSSDYNFRPNESTFDFFQRRIRALESTI